MKQVASIARAWHVPEIRKKLLFTAFILAIFRLVAHIPVAGIDRIALKSFFAQSPLLSLLDIFSGGTLANFSILGAMIAPLLVNSDPNPTGLFTYLAVLAAAGFAVSLFKKWPEILQTQELKN